MSFLEELADIFTNNGNYSIKTSIEPYGITVELERSDYASHRSEVPKIPIRYELLKNSDDGYIFIPDKEYKEKFVLNDNELYSGIAFVEIQIICKVMKCIESHKEEINKICKKFHYKKRLDK